MDQRPTAVRKGPPLGAAVGLLAACVTTLIGIARGLSPEVILVRAAVAALVCGLGTRAVVAALQYLARDS